MTTRDRLVVIAVVALAVLAGFWFMLVAPQRQKASDLQGKVGIAQTQLESAKSTVVTNSAARAAYDRDYADVARLGKAVPTDAEIASLLVQLQGAAKHTHVDFREIDQGASTIGPTPTPPAPTTGTTATTATTATTPAAAPVSATASTTLAPGASVGAGLTTIPFTLIFTGNYFQLTRFVQAVEHFTTVHGKVVNANGRLLVIGEISLEASTKGFPDVRASITATAYQMADESATAATSATADPAVAAATATAAASTTGSAPATPAPAATIGGTP